VPRDSLEILHDPPPPDADLRVVYGPEPLQFGDLRLPPGAGPHPLVVNIHGGYWQAIYNLTHAGHLCADLTRRGIATWNVEYRRIGDPGGGWPAVHEDTLAAIDHVAVLARTQPIDLDRVLLMGHSAGGHLALLAGIRTALTIRGVVSLAGVVDLHEIDRLGDDNGIVARMLGGRPEEAPALWRDASPRSHLPLGIRFVLACGTEDVHWGPNEAFAEAARAAGDEVELLPLPGAGHFEVIDPLASEWAVIRAKALELLGS